MRRRGVPEPGPARRGRRGGAELRVPRFRPARRSCSRPPAATPGLVSLFADAVPYPVATSFAVEVYRILPNDTDFSPFRDSGRFTGLNSAYIDGSAIYHSPEDRPEYMDRRFAAAPRRQRAWRWRRALGAADLTTESACPAAGMPPTSRCSGTLLTYPGWLVWPIALLALAGGGRRGSAGDAPRAGRRRPARRRVRAGAHPAGGRAGVGAAVLVAAEAAPPRLREHDRPVVARLVPGRRGGAGGDRAAHLVRAAAPADRCAGPVDRCAGLAGGARRRARRGHARRARTSPRCRRWPAGWPSLVPCTVGAVSSRGRARAVAGAVAVLVLAPTVLLFFPALGLAVGGAAALFATMLGMALLPLLEVLFPVRDRSAVGLAGPRPAGRLGRAGWRRWSRVGLTVVFTVDRARGRPVRRRASGSGAADVRAGHRYRAGVLGTAGLRPERLVGPVRVVRAGPQRTSSRCCRRRRPSARRSSPTCRRQIVRSTSTDAGGNRTVTVTVTPQRDVRLVLVEVPDAIVLSATAAGREVPSIAGDRAFGCCSTRRRTAAWCSNWRSPAPRRPPCG